MRWDGNVAGMETMRKAYEILIGKSERKRPLENLGVDRSMILM
jgi:hypothetical protein